MSADLYADRSTDDLNEILCAVPDHPPADRDPRHTLHDIAERILGNEYTRHIPTAQPESA